ncbi:MAG TPA: PAS domain-containing protein [Bryobacteraceae bacterium]|nr:PAS domain-containing protein [Bryobacteraceae bacterium]
MLAAGFLPRWAIVLLGMGCAVLAEIFSSLNRSFTRLSLEMLALAGCGLFVAELVRNRRMTLEAQERFRALVETSPAAIVTVNDRGFIELANQAATQMMAPRNGHLIGSPIAAFLPELHHALRWEDAPQFRTSMQCQGHRGDGESFTAEGSLGHPAVHFRSAPIRVLAHANVFALAFMNFVKPQTKCEQDSDTRPKSALQKAIGTLHCWAHEVAIYCERSYANE